MSRRVSRVMRSTFGLLFAAGLTFGASSALASPRNAECPYAPLNGQYGTTCSVHDDCDPYCPNPDSPNLCRTGCCTCYL